MSKIISKLEEIVKVVSFTVRKKDYRVSLEGSREGVKGPLTIEWKYSSWRCRWWWWGWRRKEGIKERRRWRRKEGYFGDVKRFIKKKTKKWIVQPQTITTHPGFQTPPSLFPSLLISFSLLLMHAHHTEAVREWDAEMERERPWCRERWPEGRRRRNQSGSRPNEWIMKIR
jgi:hypothetical protein